MTTETTAVQAEMLDDGVAIVARAQGAASFLAGILDRHGDDKLAELALLIVDELDHAEDELNREREDSVMRLLEVERLKRQLVGEAAT